MGPSGEIQIEVLQGDVVSTDGDVLALKYAQNLYGADLEVASLLTSRGIDLTGKFPKPSAYQFVPSGGALRVPRVLFVGVKDLWEFGYKEIREFSRNVLTALATTTPTTGHLLLTVHGVNFGLDEIEAFESLVAGLLDAITAGDFPDTLHRISFVELNRSRATRLRSLLARSLPEGLIPVPGRTGAVPLPRGQAERFRAAGYLSESKPHVFVAMPFADAMDDVFHYGIQSAVNAAGFLCERADYSVFTGDILGWIKERIASAHIVIADLSGANANVYLEVGFAWGCNRPTILLIRDEAELTFDVRGQRCIIYKKIKDLEDKLSQELKGLKVDYPARRAKTSQPGAAPDCDP
jgi:hypothetical protein